MREIIRNLKNHVNEPIDEVLWYYGVPTREMDLEGVKYIQGLPSLEELTNDPSKTRLVVIDDGIEELRENKAYTTRLFTRTVHHGNLLLFVLLQGLFHLPRIVRTNCHYMILMPSPMDQLSVKNLALQIFPRNPEALVEMYDNAMKSDKFGHLFLDFKVGGDPVLRHLGRITSERPVVYEPIDKRLRK